MPADARELLAIADRLAPQFRRAFLAAVEALNGQLTAAAILEALATGNLRALETAGAWRVFAAALEPVLREAVLEAVSQSGAATIGRFPSSIQLQLAFDRTNPKALEAVDTVVQASLADITNASRDAIRLVLRDAFTQGIPPAAVARRIRDDLGLTPRAALAVENYRRGLLEQDVAGGRADELAGRYADRLLRQRATAIARTETIRAASAGQQGAWLDAASQGLLDRAASRRFWVVTPDDRLCPLCELVPDLNPEGVGLDEPFQTAAGPVMYPPAHPLCRCAVTLHFLKEAMAA